MEGEVISEAEERFERLRRRSGLYIAPVLFLLVLWQTSGHLSSAGSRMSAILAATLSLWLTEAIPMPVTALLGATLCVLFGVANAKTVFAPFADPIIFLFIGSFMLARAMMVHRLDERFALTVLSVRWCKGRPTRVLLAFGFISATMSMWVSNTATTAMMLPIALGVLNAMATSGSGNASTDSKGNGAQRWPFATGMMLMVAYAASVGGIGTPVGSPPNLIGIGLLRSLAGVRISFFQWMAVAVPLWLTMFVVLYALMRYLHPVSGSLSVEGTNLSGYIERERKQLGKWTRAQINVLVAFGVTVGLWVSPGIISLIVGEDHPLMAFLSTHLPEGVVALIGAFLLFLLPTDRSRGDFTLTWRQAAQIDWGTILLFGGGMSLGGLMFSTGVAESLGRGVTEVMGANSLWGLTGVATGMAILMSEATSNTATANMVIPVVIAIAQTAHVNPVPPALGACIGASYGFMLPVSTPPNALVYGSGLVPLPRMIRAGVLFDLLGFAIIWAGLRILCPLMGWA